MKPSSIFTVLGASLCFATLSLAQAPAGAPAGSTGLCKDGTYYSGATKKGACKGHKGVKDWYASTTAGAAATTSAAPAKTEAGAATAPATAPKSSSAGTNHVAPPATAASGGGAGQVWVNSSSNVYHCQGDRWYGKTKKGEYMSEADAKAKGAKPDHGKACS